MKYLRHRLRLSIKQRILVLGSIAILGILISLFFVLNSQVESYIRQKNMAEKLKWSQSLLEVVYNLQKERGKTVGYLAEGQKTLLPAIKSRMESTDRAFADVHDGQGRKVIDNEELRSFREQIIAQKVTAYATFLYYTRSIEKIIYTLTRVQFSGCVALNQDLQTLVSLVNAMEYMGQIRGMVYMSLFDQSSVQDFVRLTQLRFEMTISDFFRSASSNYIELYNKNIIEDAIQDIFSLAESAQDDDVLQKNTEPEYWFQISTNAVDALKKVVMQINSMVVDKIESEVRSNQKKVFFLSILLVVLVSSLFYLSLSTLKNILQPFGRLLSGINEVTAGNDLSHRISLQTGDELDVIADGFNRLLDTAETLVKEKDQQARQDPLTGIGNRLYFNEALVREIDRAKRYRKTLGLILFDIDHFKKVNDTHGHDVGDQVLQSVAGVVRDLTRSTDIPARWGGEEFVLLAPESDLTLSRTLAEKLRAALASHNFPLVGKITASFGVASFQPGDSADSLLKRADKALFTAKHRGRDRVVAGESD